MNRWFLRKQWHCARARRESTSLTHFPRSGAFRSPRPRIRPRSKSDCFVLRVSVTYIFNYTVYSDVLTGGHKWTNTYINVLTVQWKAINKNGINENGIRISVAVVTFLYKDFFCGLKLDIFYSCTSHYYGELYVFRLHAKQAIRSI